MSSSPPNDLRQARRGKLRDVACAAATALVVTSVPAAAAAPTRIVSMNLCTDQLLMLIADRAQILSVSYLAAESKSSALAKETEGLRLNYGSAEEILSLKPDLLLAGSFTTRPTVFLLRKLGYRIVEIPAAATLEDIRSNIRAVAKAVGRTKRGEALIGDFDRNLPAKRLAQAGPQPLAALYWANGYTSGKDTLANAALEVAGFRTVGRELALSGTGQLPLETLLTAKAVVLVVGRERKTPALANEFLYHPALRHAFAKRPIVSVPDYLWVCGTPFVASAIARLSTARENLKQLSSGEVIHP